MLIKTLILIIGILHIYFFMLEGYLYTKSLGRKIFKLDDEKIKYTKVWAFNQAFYNLCLGVGLILAAFLNNSQMIIFLLSFVAIVGIVGAQSFSKKIFWLQAFPAIITLIIICTRI